MEVFFCSWFVHLWSKIQCEEEKCFGFYLLLLSWTFGQHRRGGLRMSVVLEGPLKARLVAPFRRLNRFAVLIFSDF